MSLALYRGSDKTEGADISSLDNISPMVVATLSVASFAGSSTFPSVAHFTGIVADELGS